jgi:hypothetical protein
MSKLGVSGKLFDHRRDEVCHGIYVVGEDQEQHRA